MKEDLKKQMNSCHELNKLASEMASETYEAIRFQRFGKTKKERINRIIYKMLMEMRKHRD